VNGRPYEEECKPCLLEGGETTDFSSIHSTHKICQDGGKPEYFCVPCETYPFFRLSLLSASLKHILGVDAESLIETWDDDARIGNGWITHEMETDQDVSNSGTLLYQMRGVEDGKGMEDEIEKIHTQGKSRKRPVDYNSAGTSDCVVRARTSQMPVKHIPHTTIEPAAPTVKPVQGHTTASPALSISDDPFVDSTSVHTSNFTKSGAAGDVILTTQDSFKGPGSKSDLEDDEPNDDDQLVPATKMAPWPLRYF